MIFPKSNYLGSTHLADLKALTHDLLYETYRTEKLSRTVHSDTQCVYVKLSVVPKLTRICAGTPLCFRRSSQARVSVSRRSNFVGRRRRCVLKSLALQSYFV